jgi:hypothetical protein
VKGSVPAAGQLARAEDEASDAKLDAHDEDSLYYW